MRWSKLDGSATETEVVRVALWEFVRRHRLALLEEFRREDIEWALQQKRAMV